jgi:hypothetical protein
MERNGRRSNGRVHAPLTASDQTDARSDVQGARLPGLHRAGAASVGVVATWRDRNRGGWPWARGVAPGVGWGHVPGSVQGGRPTAGRPGRAHRAAVQSATCRRRRRGWLGLPARARESRESYGREEGREQDTGGGGWLQDESRRAAVRVQVLGPLVGPV